MAKRIMLFLLVTGLFWGCCQPVQAQQEPKSELTIVVPDKSATKNETNPSSKVSSTKKTKESQSRQNLLAANENSSTYLTVLGCLCLIVVSVFYYSKSKKR